MNFNNVNLRAFNDFANTQVNSGQENAANVSFKEGTFSLGGRTIRVSATTVDSKEANFKARDSFMRALKDEFGGRLPEAVKTALGKNFVESSKPLTARTIKAIVKVASDVKTQAADSKAQTAPVKAPASRPVYALDPALGVKMSFTNFSSVFNGSEQQRTEYKAAKETYDQELKAYNTREQEIQEYDKKVEDLKKDPEYLKAKATADTQPKTFGGLFSSLFGAVSEDAKYIQGKLGVRPKSLAKPEEPKATYFTFGDKLEFSEEAPEPKTNKSIRESFVVQFTDFLMKAKTVSNEERANLIQSASESIMGGDMEKPLRVDDEAVIELMKKAEEIRKRRPFEDFVSRDVTNRGTIRINANMLMNGIVKELLGKLPGVKDGLSYESLNMQPVGDGIFKLDLKKANVNVGAFNNALSMVKLNNVDLSITLKTHYDAGTGRLHLDILEKDTNPGLNLAISIAKRSALKPTDISGQLFNVLETAKGSTLSLAFDLTRVGSNLLKDFGLNGSAGANISDIKFAGTGVIIRLGDADKANAGKPGYSLGNDADHGNHALSLDLSVSKFEQTIQKTLLNKLGVDGRILRVRTNRADGTINVTMDNLDLTKPTAGKTGVGMWFLRKLGLVKPGNVSVTVKPRLDRQGKLKLSIQRLACPRHSLIMSIAQKFLPNILESKLVGIKGVRNIKNDRTPGSIAEVEVDTKEFLGKLDSFVGLKLAQFDVRDDGIRIAVDRRNEPANRA